ncbi:MAG: UDP-N-acetylglucosamine 1-carboxyvinyltransferase [Calditrichaeota bacterium]|nr:MAG: UDP-N-acetylglucosamine 1-carboxyvinyltransferase [Calditrichota bacterium]
MDRFVIQGGGTLAGTIKAQGNKNEALPAIAACLLTREPVILHNVPRIGDVLMMIDILKSLGAEVTEITPHDFRICCRDIHHAEPDASMCRHLRAAILLAGPLLTRFNQVILPPPGGDVIGRRRLDDHFLAFKSLGAQVGEQARNYVFQRKNLVAADIFLEEQSVTATENALMAAVLAKGETKLQNAACEPHVVGLTKLLNTMGAKISGVGANMLQINGVDELGGAEHTIGSDLLEIGGYIVLAAITKSSLRITGTNPDELRIIHSTYRKLGIHYKINGDHVVIPSGHKMVIQPDFAGDIPKIDDGTWPNFPTDLMSIVIVAATQAEGTVLFFEKMYDGRMFFVDHLIGMGARIVLCDPHRVVVVGPSQLYGTQVTSPDIRAGMALVLAALCAQGETTIYNIRQIDRGYENLESKLQQLGANIKRLSE